MISLMQLLVVLAVIGTVLNTLLIVVLWGRHGTINDMHTRVVVLEERISGMSDIKSKMAEMSEQMAALQERSESTLDAVHSIQEFLRGGGRER